MRVFAVVAVPAAVDVLSASGVSNVPGVLAIAFGPAVVGVRAVVGSLLLLAKPREKYSMLFLFWG
jgi:hypothetical protein